MLLGEGGPLEGKVEIGVPP